MTTPDMGTGTGPKDRKLGDDRVESDPRVGQTLSTMFWHIPEAPSQFQSPRLGPTTAAGQVPHLRLRFCWVIFPFDSP